MLPQAQLDKIAEQMLIDIDNYCDRKWLDENRTHLGFSLIGDECRRKLWYGFRWCKTPKPSPRVKRLFNRGHLEEDRFVDYLRGIGCIVEPFDRSYYLLTNDDDFKVLKESEVEIWLANRVDSESWWDVSDDLSYIKKANEQGVDYPVQWRVSTLNGHSGGSVDGLGYLPERFGITERVLFEFKTHGDKSFKDLTKNKMKTSKPVHYAQCCSYGYILGINYVCYVSVNKNDDDLHLEILPLNHKTGESLVQKAERIILSQEPPPRLHENPTFWLCKSCNYYSICHAKAEIDRNCRSCKFAEPAKNKQWICNKHNQVLSDEIIKKEYGCWEPIC